MTNPPRWISKQALLILHEISVARFGGASGMRDEGLLDSALARPENIFAYRPDSSLAQLSAAYGFGIAKNHAFVDGNKRAAFLAMGLFLSNNGARLLVTQEEATSTVLALAAGELDEHRLAAWIEKNTTSLPTKTS
jgi:death-on-curing protein